MSSQAVKRCENQSPNRPVGQHLLADLFGVARDRIVAEQILLDLFIDALEAAGCRVLSHTSHKFPGVDAGVTGLILLSESHASFHTYPEHGYVAMDVFVCGDVDPKEVLASITQALGPERVEIHLQPRGS